MAELKCQVEKMVSAEEQVLTVGERFSLRCFGDQLPPKENSKLLQLAQDPPSPYSLVLLRAELVSANELLLEVTSDLVGKHDLKTLRLQSGDQSWPLSGVQLEVRSVQDPKAPVQEPYGSVGPVGLSIPWIYWVGLLAVISGVGILISWRLVRRSQRRRQVRSVLVNAGDGDPTFELFSKIRRYQRTWDFLLRPHDQVELSVAENALVEIATAYHLFLTRIFQIPFGVWSTTRALKCLQREQSQLAARELDLIQKILRELDRSRSAKLMGRDFDQLLDWMKKSCNQLPRQKGEA